MQLLDLSTGRCCLEEMLFLHTLKSRQAVSAVLPISLHALRA